MSDMTVEKARRILTPGNGDEGIRYGAIAAQSFIEGHASRDLEVENLKIKIMVLTNNAKGTPWTQGEIEAASSRASQTERILELSAEVEKLKSCTKEKFSCPCGETTYLLEQNPNHFVGCISHNPTEVKDLKSQIESWKRTAGEAGKNWQQSAEASNELLEQLEAERESSRKLAELLAEAIFFWGQFPEFKFDFAAHGWERFDKWKDETKAVLKEATPKADQ